MPAGVPAPAAAVTVAVNVTACPASDGLAEDASVVPVAAGVTVCVSEPLLAVTFVLPPYVAMMACTPTDTNVTFRLATPPTNVAVPSVVAPSLNVTVPLAPATPGATTPTVAVSVTDCPTADGFCDDVNVVVDAACCTFCVRVGDTLAV